MLDTLAQLPYLAPERRHRNRRSAFMPCGTTISATSSRMRTRISAFSTVCKTGSNCVTTLCTAPQSAYISIAARCVMDTNIPGALSSKEPVLWAPGLRIRAPTY